MKDRQKALDSMREKKNMLTFWSTLQFTSAILGSLRPNLAMIINSLFMIAPSLFYHAVMSLQNIIHIAFTKINCIYYCYMLQKWKGGANYPNLDTFHF